MGRAGFSSSQGLGGVGGCLWHQGCLWPQLFLSVRGAGRAEGHRLGHATAKSWHGAPVLTAALLCWGVSGAVGTPGFTTKRLAPWRLLARVSFAGWPGWQERGSAGDAPLLGKAGVPRVAGHPAGCAGSARGAAASGERFLAGAERSGRETRAGIARLRESLCRPAEPLRRHGGACR